MPDIITPALPPSGQAGRLSLREMAETLPLILEAGSLDEIRGMPLSRLIHPEDWPAFLALHEGALGGARGQLLFRITGLNGTEHWLETHSVPLESTGGAIRAVLSVTHDVTERQRDSALRETEARVLDLVSQGVPVRELLETITRDVDRLLHPVLSSILLVEEGRLRHGAAPHLPESYNRLVDGLEIGEGQGSCGTAAWRKTPVIVTDTASDPLWEPYRDIARTYGIGACWSNPILDAGDRVVATFALYYGTSRSPDRPSRDFITRIGRFLLIAIERSQQLQRLHLSEERFRLAAQATSDVIWDIDLVKGLAWYSEGMREHFGHDPSVFAAGLEAWKALVHPDDLPALTAAIDESLDRDADGWVVSYRFRRADGTYADLEDRTFVMRDTAGNPVRMIGSMRDLTEQRRLEGELRQSQRLDAIGQLTGGIAHDFNNLLTVILGNADLLADELQTAPRLQGLARMTLTAAQRAADLTNRLLAFSRKQALEPKVVDINQIVSGMEDLLRRALGKHIDIVFMLDASLPRALVDRAQLESALLNLCINARDAMPEGGRLTIGTHNDPDTAAPAGDPPGIPPGDYILIAVSDTGTGMDPTTLARAFEPFFSTKPPGKGSGLGLSMVYGFVRQSSGHVHIVSERGEGTSIRLYLPCAEGEPDTGPPPPTTALPQGRECVLLVEDDPLVLQHARQLLTSLGYAVLSADNGHQALALLESDATIDLLFTDVVMPGGLTGGQLADIARARRPGLPVLFTSGYTGDAMLYQGQLEPGTAMLHKPYQKQMLAVKLRQVLDSGRREDQRDSPEAP